MSLVEFCKKPAVQILGACLLPNTAGLINARITKNRIQEGWYESLVFPPFRPPNWVFGPVWTYLYTSMGYASYLVWKTGGGFSGVAKIPLALYGTQLALNWAWTPIFFGLKDLKHSAIEIVALTTVAAATGVAFYRVNQFAGLLFVPYLAWLSLASALNYRIYRDTPKAIESSKDD